MRRNGQAIIDLLFDLRDRHGATLGDGHPFQRTRPRCDRWCGCATGGSTNPPRRPPQNEPCSAWRLARRELRGGLRGFRIFLACLALGVAAIAAVGTVRSAIQAGLEREGAALLGGDAEIEFTYRFARPRNAPWTSGWHRFGRLRNRRLPLHGRGRRANGPADRALTQVRAVDDAYPLIGRSRLDPPIPLAEALAPQRPPAP
jgi:predicted lysophospholipase L1 biosynthesis ABC-type transport system permease subunit